VKSVSRKTRGGRNFPRVVHKLFAQITNRWALEVDAHFEPNISSDSTTELISFYVSKYLKHNQKVCYSSLRRDTNHDAKSKYPKLYFSILFDIKP
jgi:hypothetical protein